MEASVNAVSGLVQEYAVGAVAEEHDCIGLGACMVVDLAVSLRSVEGNDVPDVAAEGGRNTTEARYHLVKGYLGIATMAHGPWILIRAIWVRDIIDTEILRGAARLLKSIPVSACLIPAEFRVAAWLPGVDSCFPGVRQGFVVKIPDSIREKYSADGKRWVSFLKSNSPTLGLYIQQAFKGGHCLIGTFSLRI